MARELCRSNESSSRKQWLGFAMNESRHGVRSTGTPVSVEGRYKPLPEIADTVLRISSSGRERISSNAPVLTGLTCQSQRVLLQVLKQPFGDSCFARTSRIAPLKNTLRR
jgi:hypothetical protein